MHWFLLLIIVSCSSKPLMSSQAPAWVEQLRSGEGSQTLDMGQKIFFRSNILNKEDSASQLCFKASRSAERIARTYFNTNYDLPLATEVNYYDPFIGDCSVTLSIDKKWQIQKRKPGTQSAYSSKKAQYDYTMFLMAKKQIERNETLKNYTFFGMSYVDVATMLQSRFQITYEGYDTYCYDFFKGKYVTVFGTTYLCWSYFGDVYRLTGIVFDTDQKFDLPKPDQVYQELK
jgi:hypothetical protein